MSLLIEILRTLNQWQTGDAQIGGESVQVVQSCKPPAFIIDKTIDRYTYLLCLFKVIFYFLRW